MNTLTFDVTIHGKGGHGSRPDQSINPIDCYVAVHTALLQFRAGDAMRPCVCSITDVDGGNSGNIIPDKLRFRGALHYVDEADAQRFQKSLHTITERICAGYQCRAEIHKPSLP